MAVGADETLTGPVPCTHLRGWWRRPEAPQARVRMMISAWSRAIRRAGFLTDSELRQPGDRDDLGSYFESSSVQGAQVLEVTDGVPASPIEIGRFCHPSCERRSRIACSTCSRHALSTSVSTLSVGSSRVSCWNTISRCPSSSIPAFSTAKPVIF